MFKTLASPPLAAVTLGAGAATIAATPAQAQLQLAQRPPLKPGDCKAAPSWRRAPAPRWLRPSGRTRSAAAYGANWSILGRRRGQGPVVPTGRTILAAAARPCFYHPVQ